MPVALSRFGDLIVPLADGEAFWIGLSVARAGQPVELTLAVALCNGDMQIAPPILIDSMDRIGGFALLNGANGTLQVFARNGNADMRGGCDRLAFRARLRGAGNDLLDSSVRLVDYTAYAAESGQAPPTPLDAGAAYRGWRLP